MNVLAKKTRLHTELSQAECCERLRDATDDVYKWTWRGVAGERHVIGSVTKDGFRLQIRINYRNSFQTVLRGRFNPVKSGTIVELKSGLAPEVLLFACVFLWIAAVPLAAGATELIGALSGHGSKHDFLGATLGVALPLFLVGMVAAGRALASSEDEELTRFVRTTLKATDADG